MTANPLTLAVATKNMPGLTNHEVRAALAEVKKHLTEARDEHRGFKVNDVSAFLIYEQIDKEVSLTSGNITTAAALRLVEAIARRVTLNEIRRELWRRTKIKVDEGGSTADHKKTHNRVARGVSEE